MVVFQWDAPSRILILDGLLCSQNKNKQTKNLSLPTHLTGPWVLSLSFSHAVVPWLLSPRKLSSVLSPTLISTESSTVTPTTFFPFVTWRDSLLPQGLPHTVAAAWGPQGCSCVLSPPQGCPHMHILFHIGFH